MTQLTAEQMAGIEKIRAWHSGAFGADVFRLFGPAGTGKTTMAHAIPEALGLRSVAYGAYTGKAVHVLRGKGCQPASTIHSAIYMPTQDAEARAALQVVRAELAGLVSDAQNNPHTPLGNPSAMTERMTELESEIESLEAQCRQVSWEWNPISPWSSLDLIILDEVSMVDAKLAADIERYGVPVLVLGDPAQLPPVEGGGYYTEATPDHLLTEIHRQALESQPLRLATSIRTSTGTTLGLAGTDYSAPSLARAMQSDQLLCWTNKRRWIVINAIRTKLGRTPGVPEAGDRIMCLTNNKDLAVFNGAQFHVLDVTADSGLGPTLRVRGEDDGHERDIPCFSDGFRGREAQDTAKRSGAGRGGQRMLATFANAITVHKAQGSEWPDVYVVDETPAMISMTAKREGAEQAWSDARRWAYTAVSRASKSVTIVAGGRG
jgi:exodeoxyribonuclease-5